jgi:hypothetical protein
MSQFLLQMHLSTKPPSKSAIIIISWPIPPKGLVCACKLQYSPRLVSVLNQRGKLRQDNKVDNGLGLTVESIGSDGIQMISQWHFLLKPFPVIDNKQRNDNNLAGGRCLEGSNYTPRLQTPWSSVCMPENLGSTLNVDANRVLNPGK